jgi:hypothetical protein
MWAIGAIDYSGDIYLKIENKFDKSKIILSFLSNHHFILLNEHIVNKTYILTLNMAVWLLPLRRIYQFQSFKNMCLYHTLSSGKACFGAIAIFGS